MTMMHLMSDKLLKTRVAEHRNHARRNALSVSVIADHMMHHNHDIDWNNAEVLDVEKYYHKRLVSEMLHIKNKEMNLIYKQTRIP